MSGVVTALVQGVQADRAAATWAALEAARRGCPLLITALPSPGSAGGRAPQPVTRILSSAAHWARLRQPELEVRTDTSGAPGYGHVINLSRTSALLVLATFSAEPGRPSVLGPPADSLAVHAHCQVVALSAIAASRTDVHHGNVVVGWSRDRSARHALDVAADEATLRDSRLTVVTVPPPDDPAVTRIFGRPDHESELVAAVAQLEQRHPGLVIDLLHRTGSVAAELSRAARHADLLVVGCHHSDKAWSTRPGPVAGPLMMLSPAPVLLVRASQSHAVQAQVPSSISATDDPLGQL